LRNIFNFTDDEHQIREIKLIISNKLNHYYYLGNLFLIACLSLWSFEFSTSYGISISLSVLASVFYMIAYFKIKKMKIKGFMNIFGFSINSSFILAFTNLISVISIIILLEKISSSGADTKDIISTKIEIVYFITHSLIFSTAIILLVFFKDLYYILFILFFQIGIVITNKDHYNKEYKFTFVFMILTAISFLFSLLCVKQKEDDHYGDELENKYNEERKKEEIL